MAPITTVSISCINPELRAKSSGLMIFIQHILGDMISPPIIGIISDTTGSLRTGLQITWIVVLLSGAFWWLGGYFLSDFVVTFPVNLAEGSMSTTYYELIFGESSGSRQESHDNESRLTNSSLSHAGDTTGNGYRSSTENDILIELSALKLNHAL